MSSTSTPTSTSSAAASTGTSTAQQGQTGDKQCSGVILFLLLLLAGPLNLTRYFVDNVYYCHCEWIGNDMQVSPTCVVEVMDLIAF